MTILKMGHLKVLETPLKQLLLRGHVRLRLAVIACFAATYSTPEGRVVLNDEQPRIWDSMDEILWHSDSEECKIYVLQLLQGCAVHERLVENVLMRLLEWLKSSDRTSLPFNVQLEGIKALLFISKEAFGGVFLPNNPADSSQAQSVDLALQSLRSRTEQLLVAFMLKDVTGLSREVICGALVRGERKDTDTSLIPLLTAVQLSIQARQPQDEEVEVEGEIEVDRCEEEKEKASEQMEEEEKMMALPIIIDVENYRQCSRRVSSLIPLLEGLYNTRTVSDSAIMQIILCWRRLSTASSP